MYPKYVFEQFRKPNVNVSMVLTMFTWWILCSTWDPTKLPGLLWGGPQELHRCLWGSPEGPDMKGSPWGGSRAPPGVKITVLCTHGFAVCAPNVTNIMVLVFSLNEAEWGCQEGPGGSRMHGSGVLAGSQGPLGTGSPGLLGPPKARKGSAGDASDTPRDAPATSQGTPEAPRGLCEASPTPPLEM